MPAGGRDFEGALRRFTSGDLRQVTSRFEFGGLDGACGFGGQAVRKGVENLSQFVSRQVPDAARGGCLPPVGGGGDQRPAVLAAQLRDRQGTRDRFDGRAPIERTYHRQPFDGIGVELARSCQDRQCNRQIVEPRVRPYRRARPDDGT